MDKDSVESQIVNIENLINYYLEEIRRLKEMKANLKEKTKNSWQKNNQYNLDNISKKEAKK